VIETEVCSMIEMETVERFLAGHRVAVVGASDDQKNFGKTVVQALHDHGYDVVVVHPHAQRVAGCPVYADLASVPGDLDGVVVMVNGAAAPAVVDACAARGINRVWLFKGLGAAGAASDDAVARCRAHGIDVVDGACPLMFLEPVGWFHRAHRGVRRARGAISKSSADGTDALG
jgi:predicted CoA-binding protein